ncbi:hypothetical protein BDV09DRAFT_188416 [Aspergillus tetrazonus]
MALLERLCGILVVILLFNVQNVRGHVIYGRGAPSLPVNATSISDQVPSALVCRQSAGDLELRILPLGASITWGLKSETHNGYRKYLRDQLRFDGWEVNMVGSKHDPESTMKDNDVEAHSGDTIDMVHAAARASLAYKPNVVLINAGTNDCRLGIEIPEAGARMRSLIETLIQAEDMSRTLIVLSTLLPTENAQAKANVPSVNAQYRTLVKTMREEGVSIVLAEMNRADGWIAFPNDFADDTHPNEAGYKKMASTWHSAIKDAANKNLIVAPAAFGSPGGSDGQCEKEYGTGVYAGGLTQRGSGEEDGIYYHDSEAMGEVFTVLGGEDDFDTFFFARIFSRDRDDMLRWTKCDGSVRYLLNRNIDGHSTKFVDEHISMTVEDNCNPAGVNFIDINADGLDDFVCIAKDGTAYASINTGEDPPRFVYKGLWKSREGHDQANVRLGDVDGDGRADYCVVAGNGDITCWRNGWVDDMPKYWQPLGKRFTGKGMGDLRGVRLEDINGDSTSGRDDWLWVDDVGATTTYTNARSCQTGEEGDGLNIVWRPGYHKGYSSGPTHFGMSDFASSGLRRRVHFARIYGVPQDFGLLGRLDYVFVDRDDNPVNGGGDGDNVGGYTYRIRVWKNKGSGGTKIKADGNRYCNMLGHDDGRMDYVWILSKGDMRIYPNKGLSFVSNDGESYWGPNYVIFDPASMSINRDLDRRDLHLVDWDGDGACDIIWTDPDNLNRPRLFRNRIKETGDFNWEYTANPAPTVACPERRGLGFFDRPVQLADITGNGKADYLCIEKDGRTWGWVHNDNGWELIDQVKFSEAKDRANLHWADVNGDGRADLIHTNKFNGDGTVWYNRGRREIGGSQFWWEPAGLKYEGAVAGSCTYFPDLDGDGRADMHAITHSMLNTAETWYNKCELTDSTGDDGPITDPGLPRIPE